MGKSSFNPQDPFPLISLESYSYREAQVHSAEVDRWLGIPVESTERDLTVHSTHRPGMWVGLKPEALQTPYSEIRLMLYHLHLKAGDSVVDLGAGYGRMGFVVGKHYPQVKFLGYEILAERVDAGNIALALFHYPNVSLQRQDITLHSFQIPDAGYYFIYDFGTRENIEQILIELKELSKQHPITVIGRGRATRDRIERQEPWLSQIVAPQHLGNFSIYKSAE